MWGTMPPVFPQLRKPGSKAHVLSVVPLRNELLLGQSDHYFSQRTVFRCYGLLCLELWSLYNKTCILCEPEPRDSGSVGGWSQLQSTPPIFISFRCQVPASSGEAPADLLFASVTSYVGSRTSINKGH